MVNGAAYAYTIMPYKIAPLFTRYKVTKNTYSFVESRRVVVDIFDDDFKSTRIVQSRFSIIGGSNRYVDLFLSFRFVPI